MPSLLRVEPSARKREAGFLTPRQIYRHLDRFVIGQREAKRAVAIAAYSHLKRVEARRRGGATLLRKSNLLLIGPTGSGKTHLAQHLAQALSVPFSVVDATEYTEAGYYGKDVELMVAELLQRADFSVERAQRGIVFIDEVDKIARRSQLGRNSAAARDIGGEGVQQALLKLLEGREVTVPLAAAPQWSRQDSVSVDTHDVLFVCAGAFSDLLGVVGEDHRRPVGFSGGGPPAGGIRKVTHRRLVEFGMLPEFLGRLPVVVQLTPLREEELLRVLTEPPDALTREFRQWLALEGVELSFTSAALEEVARYALERGMGARGLRAIMEHVLSDVLFEAPDRRRKSVRVTPSFVRRRLAGVEALTAP